MVNYVSRSSRAPAGNTMNYKSMSICTIGDYVVNYLTRLVTSLNKSMTSCIRSLGMHNDGFPEGTAQIRHSNVVNYTSRSTNRSVNRSLRMQDGELSGHVTRMSYLL